MYTHWAGVQAPMAHLAARRSHSPKLVGSILTGRILICQLCLHHCVNMLDRTPECKPRDGPINCVIARALLRRSCLMTVETERVTLHSDDQRETLE